MKDYNEKYHVPGLGFVHEYPQHSDMPENGPGLTERAHEIMAAARSLSTDIRVLRAVNMDRLADALESAQQRILMLAGEIPGIVNKELVASIRHGENMMGGLLGVALKFAEKEDEIARLKNNQV